MELGLILGRNLEKPGKRQNLGVFQGFSRSNFAFLPFSRFFHVFQVFQVTWQPCSWLVLGANTFSPTEVGALSVVAHPDIGQCLSFLFVGLALLLVSQPVAVYHLTHSITSAVGSLLPEVSHLKACFHSGRREWQSPRMGRLALSPDEHASALSAQRRQRKLCPNFFLHNLHTRTPSTR